jgi:hypothetical protein
MQEQEAIGWNYAFRGYLSYSWTHLQHQEHPRSTAQGLRRQELFYFKEGKVKLLIRSMMEPLRGDEAPTRRKIRT